MAVAPAAQAAESADRVFQPTPDLGVEDLQSLLGEGAPDLEPARLQVDLAHAAARQSRLVPNPTLDLGWGTIPVGTLNPPGLEHPLARVPNYGVGLSFLVELGKRGPRIRQARATERATRAELAADTRARALDLAQILGELATASLRVEGFEQIVENMNRTVDAARARVSLSFGAPLDVDRLEIELARTRALLLDARSDVNGALADCSAVLGRICDNFASAGEARAYLEAWIDATDADVDSLVRRPDLIALSNYADAAQAAGVLARHQAIPNPTLRFGYFHDTFTISGNQLNSLNLSLSFGLPIIDRGQAARDAAQARHNRIQAEYDKRLAAARAQIPALVKRAGIERERRRELRDDAIPAAKDVAAQLEQAAEQRLTSISEVLQARRVLRELLLEEADAYAAAYLARIELLRALAPTSEVPG